MFIGGTLTFLICIVALIVRAVGNRRSKITPAPCFGCEYLGMDDRQWASKGLITTECKKAHKPVLDPDCRPAWCPKGGK